MGTPQGVLTREWHMGASLQILGMDLGINSWKDAAQTIAPFLTISVLVATLWMTRRLNRSLKKADTTMQCHARFDELRKLQHELTEKASAKRRAGLALDKSDEEAAYHYFMRFFSLQFDEFCAYRDGFIDNKHFGFWMLSRNRQWRNNIDVGGMTYREGWRRCEDAELYESHRFPKMLNDVHSRTSEKGVRGPSKNTGAGGGIFANRADRCPP